MKSALNSIKLKLVLVNIVISLFIILAFYFINYYYSNKIILSLITDSVEHLSNAAENSLELAMLTEEKESLNAILNNISSEKEIRNIFIADIEDTIKFSSNAADIGKVVHSGSGGGAAIYVKDNLSSRTDFLLDELNKEFIRHTNPIIKKDECIQCHESDNMIIGNLVIDFSLDFVEKQRSSLRFLLIMLIIGTSILLIILGNIIIHKFVLNKLSAISKSINSIRDGNFKERIKIQGKDEIDSVARNFNEMIETVNSLMGEVQKDKTYLENLINSINDGILVINMDYTVSLANKALLEKTGLTIQQVKNQFCYKVKGNYDTPCRFADQECPLDSIRKTGRPEKIIQILNLPGKDKEYFEIYASPMKDEHGEVVQIIEVIRDISERKNLEKHLIQSEKLASIGVLTTNVAHEINNPMASVATCAEGLQKRLKAVKFPDINVENTFNEYLQTIKNAAFRCKSYTDRLLSFSAPSELDFEIINVNAILREITALLEPQADNSGKSISLELAENISDVRGDQTQLAQIFLNLIANGLDAAASTGKVTVRSEVDSNEIKVSIEDDGKGVDENIKDKIFEPFFTTKEKGKGTGLGLYISKYVIEKHGGRIEVRNLSGGGAAFIVYIPNNHK